MSTFKITKREEGHEARGTRIIHKGLTRAEADGLIAGIKWRSKQWGFPFDVVDEHTLRVEKKNNPVTYYIIDQE